MTITCVIATFGDRSWQTLANERAYPSTVGQPFVETIIWHEPDESLSTARNRAAGRARGDWLCFLDADDELAPGYAAAMKEKTGRLIDHWTGGFIEFGHFGAQPCLFVPAVQYIVGGVEQQPRILDTGRPLIDINRAVIGTLIPRPLFEKLGGFREDIQCYEDWALWVAAEADGAKLIDVPGAVYRAHVDPSGRNGQGQPCAEAYRKVRSEYGMAA